MTLSVNQFRHLYVATAKATVNDSAAVGTIDVKYDTAKTHLYFPYMGAGGQVRSDLIQINDIISAKATDASKMATSLKSFAVALSSSINSGNPIAGVHYVLKIQYTQFASISDEDIYYEYGDVLATSGMTPSDFYKKLAISLAKNTAKQGLVSVKVMPSGEGATAVAVTATTKESDLTGTYVSILVNELEQPWVLGTKEQVPVNFTVLCAPITYLGTDNTEWASVTAAASAGTINNGKKVADMEYFYMGERGDIYRNVGWPHVIPTKYLVNPNSAYHTFDIHYAWVGAGENPQKSEKDLTIVCADKAELNKVITAFNTATGLSVATLA